MKKYKLATLAVVAMGLCTQVFADCSSNGGFTPFTTAAQEQACCPSTDATSENALFFKANNPMPNTAGVITGQQNNLTFVSTSNSVPAPQTLSSNNAVENANYSQHSGTSYYGYISGNKITCFYTYNQATTGGPYFLNMQSTNN